MNQVEITTIDFLHKLEIPQHLRGYEYIKTGVRLLIEKPDMIYAITKELYPAIAKEHGTKANRIERGIRHLIQNRDMNYNAMKVLLHIKGNRPTVGHFLAALAEAVRWQMAREGSHVQASTPNPTNN